MSVHHLTDTSIRLSEHAPKTQHGTGFDLCGGRRYSRLNGVGRLGRTRIRSAIKWQSGPVQLVKNDKLKRACYTAAAHQGGRPDSCAVCDRDVSGPAGLTRMHGRSVGWAPRETGSGARETGFGARETNAVLVRGGSKGGGGHSNDTRYSGPREPPRGGCDGKVTRDSGPRELQRGTVAAR